MVYLGGRAGGSREHTVHLSTVAAAKRVSVESYAAVGRHRRSLRTQSLISLRRFRLCGGLSAREIERVEGRDAATCPGDK